MTLRRFLRDPDIPVILIALAGFFLPLPGSAQSGPPGDLAGSELRRVVIEPSYDAGPLVRFFLGSRYREAWSDSVSLPVLDLHRFAGGLTPVSGTSDAETSTLAFRDDEGILWFFRSRNKDWTWGFPPDLRETVVDDIRQDVTSAQLPGSSPVTSALLGETGVLTPGRRLVVLPDDPALGRFRDAFAGMVGTLEDGVAPAADGGPGFAGASTVLTTDSVSSLLRSGPRHRIHARELLTARLVDLLVGDRDRHAGQWFWIPTEGPEGVVWRPVPLDRDAAFIGLDGLALWLFRTRKPKIVGFDEEYPSIRGLTWNAWDVDRRLLTSLDKGEWDLAVTDLRSRLTDRVIEDAVRNLPPEIHRRRGAFLTEALKRRRDRLREAADEFYDIVNEEAEVLATDRPEEALFIRHADGSVELQLRVAGAGEASEPHLRRVFRPSETEEVRLRLEGGDDRVEVRAAGSGGAGTEDAIWIRVVGGAGDDVFVNRGEGRGERTGFYGHEGDDGFDVLPGTVVSRRPYRRPPGDDSLHEFALDWGSQWYPHASVDFNSDHGLVVTGGRTLFDYGFRKHPHAMKLSFTVGASTSGKALAEYLQEFRELVPDVHGVLHVRFSGLDSRNFHGFGNATPDDDDVPGSDPFEVDRYDFELDPRLVLTPTPAIELEVGPVLKWGSADEEEGEALDRLGDVYGEGTFWQVGARAGFRLDRTETPVWPRHGFRVGVEGEIYPEALDVVETFGSVDGELTGYLPLPDSSALALRAGGKRVFGRVPFHEAAYLGSRALRFERSQRYAGDTSLYGSAELRVPLGRVVMPWTLLPTEVGVFAFGDAGRVWVDGESPGGFHVGGGGGAWLSPVDRSYTFRGSVAAGEGNVRVELGAGFNF